MKSILNNQVVRMVRDEVNDLRKTSNHPQADPQPAPTAPSFYHQPRSSDYQSSTDSYSHTAHSTAGFSSSSAYPTLPTNNDTRDKHNFLGRIESTATNLVANLVGQDAAVSATHKLNSVVTTGRNARELLRNGAVVQLGSKNAGRLLQVVMSSNGVLTIDGLGYTGFNTYFTVEESEKGRIRFHNNFNYLAFDHNQPVVLPLSPGVKNNSKVDFRVHDIFGSSDLVAFESCACKHCFLSISTDGHLKTTNVKDKSIDAQFSVIPVTINPAPPMFYNNSQPQNAAASTFNPNPYGATMSPQPPMYHQQPPAADPPPYSAQDPYSQPSAPSGLYPQFH